jgi:4,5-DOPA dioxygenase extradiol
MSSIQSTADFRTFAQQLPELPDLMPALFVGHGSPMNGIVDNEFSRRWQQLAKEIPTPTAVLVISAHWFTRGTRITAMDFPKTIHDFGGFPNELYQIQYPAPGNPTLAKTTAEAITSAQIIPDHDWGLDHGAWIILKHLFPKANIPVVQLSMDYTRDARYHYSLAKELAQLRKKGVLIMGSGNMVHNLGMVAWDKLDGPSYGYDWALHMNHQFKQLITDQNHHSLINYRDLGKEALLAIPTPEHYLPLLYTLALQDKKDRVSFFNDQPVGGSLTMTSVLIK